jgi:hypothetical protein
VRYLIDNDDDGHWYLVSEQDKQAFTAWIYEGAEEPGSVVRLAGHPNNVTFEAPLEFGRPLP